MDHVCTATYTHRLIQPGLQGVLAGMASGLIKSHTSMAQADISLVMEAISARSPRLAKGIPEHSQEASTVSYRRPQTAAAVVVHELQLHLLEWRWNEWIQGYLLRSAAALTSICQQTSCKDCGKLRSHHDSACPAVN